MTNTEREVIAQLTKAVQNILMGKFGAPADIAVSGDDEDLRLIGELVEALNGMSQNLKEVNVFLRAISRGNLSEEIPGRRNFMAGTLKELHAQLSCLAFNMEQLAGGHVASKLYYPGPLFSAYNMLMQKVAALSGRPREDAPEGWAWSVNSWRYHQILSALNNLHIMVIELDDEGGIVYANKPARELLGDASSLEELVCRADGDALCRYLTQDFRQLAEYPRFDEVFDEPSGAWYKITSDQIGIIDGHSGYLLMIDNISEWKDSENRLRHKAYTDALTGASTRVVGIQELEDLLDAPRYAANCAALIDIDDLKTINDVHGHAEGDYAIKTIARALMDTVRVGDTVSRYGGDEFLVVFHQCTGPEAERIIARVHDRLAAHNAKNPKPYPLSFSHGITGVSSGLSLGTADIIALMDEGLYKVKRAKKEKRKAPPS